MAYSRTAAGLTSSILAPQREQNAAWDCDSVPHWGHLIEEDYPKWNEDRQMRVSRLVREHWNQLDSRAMIRGPRHPPIAGQKQSFEQLCERDIDRIVSSKILAKLPS